MWSHELGSLDFVSAIKPATLKQYGSEFTAVLNIVSQLNNSATALRHGWAILVICKDNWVVVTLIESTDSLT